MPEKPIASTLARISIMARTTSRGERVADAGAMRADHVALQLVEIFARDADVGKQADAGVDGVDRVVAGGQARRSGRASAPCGRLRRARGDGWKSGTSRLSANRATAQTSAMVKPAPVELEGHV